MKKPPLYQFAGTDGAFRVSDAERAGLVYFPLANEAGLLSAITPTLQGDIKLDQHSFLTLPVSFEDLRNERTARNIWLVMKSGSQKIAWSLTGRSVWQRADAYGAESHEVEAGLLWHRVTRSNKKLGIQASMLNFVPATDHTAEIMFVEVKNTSKKPIEFTLTSAVPLFGRSADNLRDHRHVTSLLNRVRKEKFGVVLCPTMSFNERGHALNHTSYYVAGCDEGGRPPAGAFSTVQEFAGEEGDLEKPLALIGDAKPSAQADETHQGKEALAALQFRQVRLKAGKTASFTFLLGVDRSEPKLEQKVKQLGGRKNVEGLYYQTRNHWKEKLSSIQFHTGDTAFNQWIRWVQVQPILRKLFGCSFLPDFDYGRGGRGWRDLWQDCLALLLQNPTEVRDDIVRNFGGVRIDGSNATIIGRKRAGSKWVPEFIADRNNIARTWMDHGVWPFLTTLLYINQTGDAEVLLEKVSYFRDKLLERGKKVDPDWAFGNFPSETQCQLRTKSGGVHRGTVLEHILVQTLVQFFNVGEHNMIRLEDADWNDGLDMAPERGESVAFTALYGGNLSLLADLLERCEAKFGWKDIQAIEELLPLLDRLKEPVNYDQVRDKEGRLSSYFKRVSGAVGGKTISVAIQDVVRDLRAKAEWIKQKVNRQEWIEHEGKGWFNGYYDNTGKRVEGPGNNGHLRMTLSGQVYPIMAGTAPDDRIQSIIKSVDRYLWDRELGGVRLNTNFGRLEPNLGRAFSFAYGEKENGAVFSHMAVMYANALYQRQFPKAGHRVLSSLYHMALNSGRSRIFPGLPEYFNNEGRGRYLYLTGSASWYVLTLLTQVFGVRGDMGDLVLAPQLDPEQFDSKNEASVQVFFAGRSLTVVFRNQKKLEAERYQVASVKGPNGPVPVTRRQTGGVTVDRRELKGSDNLVLQVELERKNE